MNKTTLGVACRPSFKPPFSFHPSFPRPLLFISTNRDNPWVEKQQMVCHPAEKRKSQEKQSTRTPTGREIEIERKREPYVLGQSPCSNKKTQMCSHSRSSLSGAGCFLCVGLVFFLFTHPLPSLLFFSVLDAVHNFHTFHFPSHIHAVLDSPIILLFALRQHMA